MEIIFFFRVGSVSRMTLATIAPDTNVNAPIAAIAADKLKKSARRSAKIPPNAKPRPIMKKLQAAAGTKSQQCLSHLPLSTWLRLSEPGLVFSLSFKPRRENEINLIPFAFAKAQAIPNPDEPSSGK